MRLQDPLDPALQAASLALNGRSAQSSSRFASIELRKQSAKFSHLAPFAYAATVVAALSIVVFVWTL